MIWLYRLIFLPLALMVAPYYGWRMVRRGGYGAHFSQRFGRVPELPAKRPGVRRVWLQAVSVGELLAAAPLLEAWRRVGGIEVYLTTTTSTGYALAEERYCKTGMVAALGYFPLDFWPCSVRAWRAVRPDLAIVMEGERWPEHLRQAARREVPVVALNARLSDRSLRRMRRLGPLVGLMLRDLSRVLAASEGDAERFCGLGVPVDRVEVIGNLKFDVMLPEVSAEAAAALRRELGFGPGAPVLLGASTWPGEEAALLCAWEARLRGTGWKLLLVPRHAERRGEVEAELAGFRARGGRVHFRSRGLAPTMEVEVCVVDTTGELARLLALADLVFIGKTLPPHTEGQTPVEAAARGKAILLGPGTSNFRAVVEELLALGAARRVADAAELERAVEELAVNVSARERLGGAALRWHAANRGAVSRALVALDRFLAAPK